MDMQTQRTDLWTQWGREKVGKIERVAWKHIYMCVCVCVCKIDSGNLLYDAGSSNQVLCDSLEGWDEVGNGREV